jgi:hypothetical protein
MSDELDRWKKMWDKEEKKLVDEINRCYKVINEGVALRKKHTAELEKIKEICLEWYRDGIDDGYYSCETGTNALDTFWEILKLLGVSQEEMDDFDPEEL